VAVPIESDIIKYKGKLETHLKQLDEDGRVSENKLVSMLRSAIRQVWMYSPVKLAKLEQGRIPDLNPNTRTKWLWECEHCGELFKQADVEVDHKKGNWPFACINDFLAFYDNILRVKLDELQILCKPHHEIKTYAEKYGLTFEEAEKEKEVIKFKKLKANEQKYALALLKLKPKRDNEEGRTEVYRRYIRGEV